MNVPMRWGLTAERVTGLRNAGRRASKIPHLQFVGICQLDAESNAEGRKVPIRRHWKPGMVIEMYRKGGGRVRYLTDKHGSLVRAQ